jgi:HAD superfamily hydrolase (TIGR01509 family)
VFADLINQLDRGQITEQKFLDSLSGVVDRTVNNDEIHNIDPTLDTTVVLLARQLSAHYSLGLLSNASPELRPKLAKLELDNLFNYILISSEMKLSKPQPEIFQAALEAMQTSAEEIVFIDDNPTNVAAAQGVGIPSLTYTSSDALVTQLRDIGVYFSL